MDRRFGFVGSVVVALVLLPVMVSAQKQTKIVFVNVADQAGSPVPNLTAADFDVTVGGVKQPVTRVTFSEPMRILVLVDSSEVVSTQLPAFRGGLNALLDALPAEDEIAVVSTGGQARARQAPTTDRKKLHAVTDAFAADGGANVFLDALLESDKRFLKNAPDRWPVFVILTTDSGTTLGSTNIDAFNGFVRDFTARGGSAHAVVVHGSSSGVTSDLALNLVENTHGIYEVMAISSSLPDKMKAIASRLASDQKMMAGRYKVEYTGNAKATQAVEVRIAREGITMQLSEHRPF